eukprot:g172.t1
MSDTFSRVTGSSLGASAAAWQATSRAHCDPAKLRDVKPRTNLRRNQRESEALRQVQEEMKGEEEMALKRQHRPRYSTNNRSSFQPPGGFGKIGKRIMQTQDGAPPRAMDLQGYEFGLHEKRSTMDKAMVDAHLESSHYSSDMPVSIYTQRMNEGMFHKTGTTSKRAPFNKNTSFTNDIQDPTKRHAEGVDDSSGRPAGPGDVLAEAVGGGIGTKRVIARVLNEISDRTGGSGIRGIATIFRRFDDSGDKKLDRYELKLGLKEHGIKVNETDLDQLFAHFDRDGSGYISFNEFLRSCRAPMSAARLALVHEAFLIVDKNRSGTISIEDLKDVYNASLHPKVVAHKLTEDQVLTQFMDQWRDQNCPDGMVTQASFVNYYTDVSASIDADEYFEEMMRRCWGIKGDLGQTKAMTSYKVKYTDSVGRSDFADIPIEISRLNFDKMRAQLHRMDIHDVMKIELPDTGESKTFRR